MLDQEARYESYKDSGLEWLGVIPSDWALKKSKYVWREIEDRSAQGTEQLLSVSQYHGVVPSKSDSRSESLEGYKRVYPDHLVTNIMLAWMGGLGISDHDGLVSPAYAVYKLRDEQNAHFLGYLYRTKVYLAEFARRSKGVVPSRWRMYTDDFGQVLTLLPPKETQNRIVSFLDEKTAEIDAAIEKKRRLIDLLNEQKAILINCAVTKGLNPDAPMKDSGVDWIGEIPAHWDVKRNAALFDESKKSGTADLPVLSVSIHHGVSRSELSEEENLRSAIKIADRTSYVEVLPGYVAYNMMRAWQGGIGAVHTHGMVSPAYVVARPRGPIHADYFERLYRTDNFIGQMDQFSKGITDFRKRLYWEEFKTLLTLVPPMEEQVMIADFCQVIVDACKDAVKATQSEISILNEFKQTLIANAVTGKIKI
ncbi:hypothetical protein DS909_11180 [Phaeobacter gallaeciensis]|uniref:Restriction endonuclease subunit S n=1 Tax=Phaeobacter gallaeciensis TaxID=60890 RepID=A0A366X1C5_9RHOB|nr:restriction endonuclease subunit S [Phaeobacter gallaeciensis]RBW54406.1 hypothetical protein DS909_11180 [Phaeobacter gallaeciensis]